MKPQAPKSVSKDLLVAKRNELVKGHYQNIQYIAVVCPPVKLRVDDGMKVYKILKNRKFAGPMDLDIK